MGLHITSGASAYLEGLWVWTADHDIDSGPQVNIWSGRGIMSESQGPVWMVGTASTSFCVGSLLMGSADSRAGLGEHNIIYQYYLFNAKNHYMGLIQTETVRPPSPSAPSHTCARRSHVLPPRAAVLPAEPGAPRAVRHEHGVPRPRDRAGRGVGAERGELAGHPRLRCVRRFPALTPLFLCFVSHQLTSAPRDAGAGLYSFFQVRPAPAPHPTLLCARI